jgi:hypothetical protein
MPNLRQLAGVILEGKIRILDQGIKEKEKKMQETFERVTERHGERQRRSNIFTGGNTKLQAVTGARSIMRGSKTGKENDAHFRLAASSARRARGWHCMRRVT